MGPKITIHNKQTDVQHDDEDEDYQTITVRNVDSSLYRRIKMVSAKEGRSVSEIVNLALRRLIYELQRKGREEVTFSLKFNIEDLQEIDKLLPTNVKVFRLGQRYDTESERIIPKAVHYSSEDMDVLFIVSEMSVVESAVIDIPLSPVARLSLPAGTIIVQYKTETKNSVEKLLKSINDVVKKRSELKKMGKQVD